MSKKWQIYKQLTHCLRPKYALCQNYKHTLTNQTHLQVTSISAVLRETQMLQCVFARVCETSFVFFGLRAGNALHTWSVCRQVRVQAPWDTFAWMQILLHELLHMYVRVYLYLLFSERYHAESIAVTSIYFNAVASSFNLIYKLFL